MAWDQLEIDGETHRGYVYGDGYFKIPHGDELPVLGFFKRGVIALSWIKDGQIYAGCGQYVKASYTPASNTK